MKHPHAAPLAERARNITPAAPRCTKCRGPTVEQWVAAGYLAEHYPPQGYTATRVPCCMREDEYP